jgi:hypothetical protein
MEEKVKKPRQKKVKSADSESKVEEPTKKTTGKGKAKKPIQVVAVVTPEGIEGTFTPEPRRPLIVHLPFQSTEVNIGDKLLYITKYDPNLPQPLPYDENGGNYFQVNSANSSSELEVGVEQEGWIMPSTKKMEQQENGEVKNPPAKSGESILDMIEPEKQQTFEKEKDTRPNPELENKQKQEIEIITKSKLMIQYETKPGEVLKIPNSTDIACFWTTETFSGIPYFIPVKEENGVYTVYGNFSSVQCALAYLLTEHLDSHVRWERMSLLHRMYKIGGRIYPAPPRECLKKFGGPYTIEDYTKLMNDEKVRIDIHMPPLISILGTLDTKPIDFYDSSVQNSFTGRFSMDRFKAWSEQGGALRLKRSKPLKDRESTLDSCIQISIKSR